MEIDNMKAIVFLNSLVDAIPLLEVLAKQSKTGIDDWLVNLAKMLKDNDELLEELAGMAYVQAKNGFTLPGLGKLVVVKRKARWGRNPATGEKIRIAAKKALKFRVAKAAKDAIMPPKK